MKTPKVFKCLKCGQVVVVAEETGVPLVCCGQEMKHLVPGTVDAAAEKHVPIVSIKDNIIEVTVGEVEHPMLEEHYIPDIGIITKLGEQRRALNPGDKPVAQFILAPGDEFIHAFERCNLHGMWRSS